MKIEKVGKKIISQLALQNSNTFILIKTSRDFSFATRKRKNISKKLLKITIESSLLKRKSFQVAKEVISGDN